MYSNEKVKKWTDEIREKLDKKLIKATVSIPNELKSFESVIR